jgi:hypothetical protein
MKAPNARRSIKSLITAEIFMDFLEIADYPVNQEVTRGTSLATLSQERYSGWKPNLKEELDPRKAM